MIVQSCAVKHEQSCQTDQQKWTNFIIWRSAQEGETSPRNQFIPELMKKWVKQHDKIEKYEFKEFIIEVRKALKQENPDQAEREDTFVTAEAPTTYDSMDKKLFDY